MYIHTSDKRKGWGNEPFAMPTACRITPKPGAPGKAMAIVPREFAPNTRPLLVDTDFREKKYRHVRYLLRQIGQYMWSTQKKALNRSQRKLGDLMLCSGNCLVLREGREGQVLRTGLASVDNRQSQGLFYLCGEGMWAGRGQRNRYRCGGDLVCLGWIRGSKSNKPAGRFR